MKFTFYQTPKLLLSIVFSLIVIQLVGTSIVFINDPPYSTISQTDTYCYFLMYKVFEELELPFIYEYADYLEAMYMVENNLDVIFIPFHKPNLPSTQFFISDPVSILTDKVFYDQNKTHNFLIEKLTDLTPYIVGSTLQYKNELFLRRAKLTVHYSQDNQQSMQKLVEGKVNVVLEEKIKGLVYLKNCEGENKNNIKYLDTNFFPEPFYILAPMQNDGACSLVLLINRMLQESTFFNTIINEFFLSFEI